MPLPEMGRVKILTGAIATLSPELAAQFGIGLVPYYVSYGGRAYAEGRDLDREDFYRWLRQGKGFPTTSHPSLEEFTEVFRRAGEEAETIIFISIAPVYSKSYGLARRAKERLPELDIAVVDSGSGAGGQALVALEAARLAAQGADKAEVLAKIAEVQGRMDVAMVLDTLKYLAHGGRIHRAQALLGSMLSIKPIVAYRDGQTTPLRKVRSHAEALEFFLQMIGASMERLEAVGLRCIVEDAANPEWAERVAERIRKEFAPEELWRLPTSAAVAAHAGLGAWGVAWYCLR